MKKTIILLILAMTFASCNKDPNLYGSKILGTWTVAEVDDQKVQTDNIHVMEFNSKGTVTFAYGRAVNDGNAWLEDGGYAYSIKKGKVYIKGYSTQERYYEIVLKIVSMDDDSFSYTVEKKMIDGVSNPDSVKYDLAKVDKNLYSSAMTGMWTGKCVTDGTGEEHHWCFFENSTFVYYSLVDNRWQNLDDEPGNFYLYGDLLATTWTSRSGPRQFECWKVSFEFGGDKMIWEGLRQNGKTVRFELFKME